MESKIEYPPLLASGFQEIKLDKLKAIFLFPFPASITRANILRRFKHWAKRVKQLNVNCEIWIDGSFVTEKIDPQDVDVVIFISSKEINRLSNDKKLKLQILTNEKLSTQQREACICDSYLVFTEDVFGKRYWEKQFGLARNKKTPKGIFRIFI